MAKTKFTEILAHNTLTGEVSAEIIERPSMKLNVQPRIVVCVPVGTKPKANVFKVEDNMYMAPAASVPATVPIQWWFSQKRLVSPLGIAVSWLSQWGMLSGEARQIMTMRAMEIVQDDGYVLYWDDDCIADPMALYTLYSFMEQNPHVGLVSGVYSTRNNPTEPVIYKEHMKGSYWGLTVGPNAVPEEIFGCGAGFMLVRAQAIRDAIAANPGIPIWADSKAVPLDIAQKDMELRFTTTWGHDMRFCRILRDAGWPSYVDGRVELGHFDSQEQKEYRLPEDSPPKVRGRNLNSQPYWNTLYGAEGPNGPRQYPEMFEKVTAAVPRGANVAEFGCGTGILGSRLTAQKVCSYRGYDISSVAVEMAKARFLAAEVLDMKDVTVDHADDVVVATELVEHLSAPDLTRFIKVVQERAKLFVFTVPDNCMGPEEIREHQALFNEELVREICKPLTDAGWQLSVEKADEIHLLVVVSAECRTIQENLEPCVVETTTSSPS